MRHSIKFVALLASCFAGAIDATAAPYDLFTLDVGNETVTNLTGINNSGVIVGYGYSDAAPLANFVYASSTFTPFTLPNYNGLLSVSGINDAGAIVGSYSLDSVFEGLGFLFQGMTITTFDLLPPLSTNPSAINNLGDTVGILSANNPLVLSYLYAGDVLTGIFPIVVPPDAPLNPFYPNIYAYGINDADIIVGLETIFGQESYIDDHGSGTAFNPPGAVASQANDINNLGQIVGDYHTDEYSSITAGYIETGSSFQTVTFPGAISTDITGINDKGEIIGDYTTPNGVIHGFYGLPEPVSVPEPASLPILAGAVIGLVALRRKPSFGRACAGRLWQTLVESRRSIWALLPMGVALLAV